jgi:hypothetical protein
MSKQPQNRVLSLPVTSVNLPWEVQVTPEGEYWFMCGNQRVSRFMSADTMAIKYVQEMEESRRSRMNQPSEQSRSINKRLAETERKIKELEYALTRLLDRLNERGLYV